MYNFDMYFFDMYCLFHPPCVLCKKLNHSTDKHQCSKCKVVGDHRSSLCPNPKKF